MAMATAVVCVASNVADGEGIIAAFVSRLRCEIDHRAEFSPIYSTLSVTDGITQYRNMVARFVTEVDIAALTSTFKCWEADAGRVRGGNDVSLDIDIVLYDGEVVRPRDYTREYFITGYKALDQER